jgi:hypothetical protein
MKKWGEMGKKWGEKQIKTLIPNTKSRKIKSH